MISRLALIAVAGFLAGCGGGGTSASVPVKPPAPGPSGTVYAGTSSRAGSVIQAYSLPLSTSSSALFSVATSTSTFCVDNFGHLLVLDSNGGLDVYSLPLAANSTPAFKLATSKPTAGSCAADGAGNLYVPEDVYNSDPFNPQVQGYIDVFQGPVHGGSTPLKTVKVPPQGSGQLTGVFDATTDSAGDVFVDTGVATVGFSPVHRWVTRGQLILELSIAEFSSLGAGNVLLATFGGGHNPKIGPDGNLYTLDAISNGQGNTEVVDVYLPSDFHNGGAKDHSITLGDALKLSTQDIAFDNVANLYVTGESPPCCPQTAVVLVFPPPYAAIGVTSRLSVPADSGAGSIAIVP